MEKPRERHRERVEPKHVERERREPQVNGDIVFLRYWLFHKRYSEKWSKVLAFRQGSDFAQCNVCYDMKRELRKPVRPALPTPPRTRARTRLWYLTRNYTTFAIQIGTLAFLSEPSRSPRDLLGPSWCQPHHHKQNNNNTNCGAWITLWFECGINSFAENVDSLRSKP
jgi:hypothetical protein